MLISNRLIIFYYIKIKIKIFLPKKRERESDRKNFNFPLNFAQTFNNVVKTRNDYFISLTRTVYVKMIYYISYIQLIRHSQKTLVIFLCYFYIKNILGFIEDFHMIFTNTNDEK